ncbi:unnamed protein product [Adineta steineri]|uniref:Uncharacterized protein n=1 Tax=Adineta steineri TaxID=433720 RepID=A0A813WT18_9BILA|nr:unnamed protein product [Adineta steineri]
MKTFEDTIEYQFHLKLKYRDGSQIWGNNTCYTTLTNCYSGLRCLVWQNICDGKQQCLNGVDEDYCEEVEYNECEENEYRCGDGSCVSEQYWLDGEYDCSDQSDEQQDLSNDFLGIFSDNCPLESFQFTCDEATAESDFFSCGDGQFTTDTLIQLTLDTLKDNLCYNFRQAQFFCEFFLEKWTLENGHCVDYAWLGKHLTDMSATEKCIFYLKCKLTHMNNVQCKDAIRSLQRLCQRELILYPLGPIFNSYTQTQYQLEGRDGDPILKYVIFNGSIKCIGYQAKSKLGEIVLPWERFKLSYPTKKLFCDIPEAMDPSGSQFDKYCWNDTKESFLCDRSHRCISKYRIKDGVQDCSEGEDEENKQRCQMTQKHRLDCLDDQSMCISTKQIGNHMTPDCPNGNDEFISSLKWNLLFYKCTKFNLAQCKVLKAYIQSPSSVSKLKHEEVLLFRQYCDTKWQLSMGFDESQCREWKCPADQYQCLSGHCIPLVLSKIGDGIIDCYGGLDERNLLSCGNNTEQQRGFDFHCDNQECIPFHRHCQQRCSNENDSLLCDKLKIPLSTICKGPSKKYRSSIYPYRFQTWIKQIPMTYLPFYPQSPNITLLNFDYTQQHQQMKKLLPAVNKEENNGEEGWICGRGVAVRNNKDGRVQCFCPPSLYGNYCQYFSDRITVITSLENIPSKLSVQVSTITTILALLVSDNEIIDNHIFQLPLVLSKDLNKKFRFNLVHLRPKALSTSYTVRFEAYCVTTVSPIRFFGVWEYLVKFPFLPSYRLAQVLKFEEQDELIGRIHICRKANPCRHNGNWLLVGLIYLAVLFSPLSSSMAMPELRNEIRLWINRWLRRYRNAQTYPAAVTRLQTE